MDEAMKDVKRKIEVTDQVDIDPEEVRKAQDFSRLVTRFDEAKKPLSNRRLFEYRNRWFFIAIIIIVLIIMIIMGLI
jgi:t-SNARE complex subunit (syntaxin)